MKNSNRVLLGMSGGTDSSVAAMLLQEAGYEVTGVTFRFYDQGEENNLCDARELAAALGIEHIVCDVREQFEQQIISYFVDEYLAGHTPVPCTRCNNELKWPLLAKLADERDIYWIATGHYVRKVEQEGRWYIRSGADADKDQSFFLWGLPQDLLSRMLLPLGSKLKTEIREYAAERGFMRVSTKKDSLGVCFCPMDYRGFLRQRLGDAAFIKGHFVDENGHFIAWHEGYPFYTIGQRRGLGIDLNRAVFVKEIRPQQNEIVLASLKSLEQTEMWLKDWVLVDEGRWLGRSDIYVKIRYRKQLNRCTVTRCANDWLHVQLHEPLTAVAMGQAAAFYKDDCVLGGGILVHAR